MNEAEDECVKNNLIKFPKYIECNLIKVAMIEHAYFQKIGKINKTIVNMQVIKEV